MLRRKFPRIRMEVPLLVRKMGTGITGDMRGQCLNLSEGGAAGMVGGEFLPGQVVLMELVLPQIAEAVRLNARVCHQQDMITGFEFLAPEPQVLETIRRACHSAA